MELLGPRTIIALLIAMGACGGTVSAIEATDDHLMVFPSDWPEDPFFDNRINILANDIPDTLPLFVEIITGPSHASGESGYWALLDGGTIYYEPDRCTYEDTILYRACDNVSCSGVAALVITVNRTSPYLPQPDGLHTMYSTPAGSSLFVTDALSFGSGIWQYRVLSWPDHGALAEPGGFFLCLDQACDFTYSIPDGWMPSFTYCPDPGFIGDDEFTYCILEDSAMFGNVWGKPGSVSFTVTGLRPVTGCASLPTDPDNDGRYEDLNGNGRRDFADVVLFFHQMAWITANEPVAAFDLNGNERIDFADIVALFNEI